MIICRSCGTKFDSQELAVSHAKTLRHEDYRIEIEEEQIEGHMKLYGDSRKHYDPLITVKSKTKGVKNPFMHMWEGGGQISKHEEEELRKFLTNVNDALPIAYMGLMKLCDAIAHSYNERVWEDMDHEALGYDIYLTFSGHELELRLTSDGLNAVYRDGDDFAHTFIGEFHADYIERGGKHSLQRFNQKGTKLKFPYMQSRELR